MIPYGHHEICESDIQAVVDVLRSDCLTQGPVGPAFENAVANYCGTKYATAFSNATSALHIACMALDVGPKDTVWTSPITFVASANCALYCGANVDFVDIDPRTYNLSVPCLEEKLNKAARSGRLPKVVIPVHLGGQSCDMAGIQDLSKRYGFRIIEDASHAIGGKYRGDAVGNCHYSDIAVFSFHPVKIITSGEGGMALTNDAALAKRMKLLLSHGITRDEAEMTHAPDGPWYYQQISLGFNCRMTELQAALGLSQLARLDEFVARRETIARLYDEMLGDLPLVTPWRHPDCESAKHLYIVCLSLAEIGKTHREVFDAMRTAGIGVNIHYIPVYLQPFFQQMGFRQGYCQEAERYYAEAISLPIYPGLTTAHQEQVICALREAVAP